jgi:hypothetical protein
MNERQRADQLAQAIDVLIHGATPPATAPADSELRSLIAVANARLGASRGAAAHDIQESVWQRIMTRLDVRPQARREVSQEIVADEAMKETIVARRQLSSSILDLAEQHRDDVWQRVQARIGKSPRRMPSVRSEASIADDKPERTRFFPTGDADLDGLLSAALDRPTLRDLSEREAEGRGRRLQDRMRNDPAKNPRRRS